MRIVPETHAKFITRPASIADVKFYFDLVNDPDVRKSAFQSDPIELSDHMNWFFKKVKDKKAKMFVLEVGPDKVGQVRFDKHGTDAEIDISVVPEWRRLGVALKAVFTLSEEIIDSGFAQRVIAKVKKENDASNNLFKRAGFKEEAIHDDYRVYSFT